MRRQFEGAVMYQVASVPSVFASWWLRVGFFSFAYRLAHLRISRVIAISALAGIFYLA